MLCTYKCVNACTMHRNSVLSSTHLSPWPGLLLLVPWASLYVGHFFNGMTKIAEKTNLNQGLFILVHGFIGFGWWSAGPTAFQPVRVARQTPGGTRDRGTDPPHSNQGTEGRKEHSVAPLSSNQALCLNSPALVDLTMDKVSTVKTQSPNQGAT